MLALREAHILSGKVKSAIRSVVPNVAGVLVHMEPYEGEKHRGDLTGVSDSSGEEASQKHLKTNYL